VEILLASLLSPITLSFVAGLLAALVGFEIRVGERALRAFANVLMFFIGIDGGRGLASSTLGHLGAGLAATAALILLLPTLSYVIARWLTKFSVVDSASLATLYGSVSSAVLMAAYAESGDMNLAVDGFVMGLAALMELGLVVALVIGTFALRGADGSISSNRTRAAEVAGGFVLLFCGLLIGSTIGDRGFGYWETAIDLILTGALAIYMVEMGMMTARELAKLRAAAARVVSFALVMPVLGGILGTFLGTLAGLLPGSVFILGAVAASASFINAPAIVRVSFPSANPSIYLPCALGVTFPVLLLIGLPLIAQMALLWQRFIGPSGS
jgi:hypothetical protein